MQRLWAQVLGIAADSIGLDDSFFRLGGDSIAAMKLVGEARRQGMQLPCLLYERATFMNGPPHQLYPPTNSETTTPRRGDVIIQEAVRI